MSINTDQRVQYGATRTATRQVKAKTTDSALLAANNSRRGLRVQNTDAANPVSLGLGEAAKTNEDIVLKAGEVWNGKIGDVVWTGAVRGIATTAEVALAVVELE